MRRVTDVFSPHSSMPLSLGQRFQLFSGFHSCSSEASVRKTLVWIGVCCYSGSLCFGQCLEESLLFTPWLLGTGISHQAKQPPSIFFPHLITFHPVYFTMLCRYHHGRPCVSTMPLRMGKMNHLRSTSVNFDEDRTKYIHLSVHEICCHISCLRVFRFCERELKSSQSD